jgi:exonuclease SbcD
VARFFLHYQKYIPKKGENMKIAITADVHLTSRDQHPERFHALENVLSQLVEQNIDILIIAGDLFDVTCTTPGEFEEIIKRKKYSKINLYIIPGNHDPFLTEGTFSLPNIKYIIRPELFKLTETVPFVFIPYIKSSSIGEVLAASKFSIERGSWVLVSHGDWLRGTLPTNECESNSYMPLSSRDLFIDKPKKVFLGHIHARLDSPSPLSWFSLRH